MRAEQLHRIQQHSGIIWGRWQKAGRTIYFCHVDLYGMICTITAVIALQKEPSYLYLLATKTALLILSDLQSCKGVAMEKFSQRMGIQQASTAVQINSINVGLRNALWNVFTDHVRWGMPSHYANKFGEQIWKYCFNKPLDEVPYETPSRSIDSLFKAIKQHYLTLEWYEVYDS